MRPARHAGARAERRLHGHGQLGHHVRRLRAAGVRDRDGAVAVNPVFKRTYVAFDFLDHKASDCTAAATPFTKPATTGNPGVEFALANVAQPGIANLLNNPNYPEGVLPDGGQPAAGFTQLDLETALRSDQGAFKHLQDFASSLQVNGDELNVGAALFFVNRQPDSTGTVFTFLDGGAGCNNDSPQCTPPYGQDCNPALDDAGDMNSQNALVQEIVAADKLGLASDFVVLANSLYGVGDPLPYYRQVQSLVKAQGVSSMQVIDATAPIAKIATVLANFSNVAASFGTCLYEMPAGVGVNGTLKFTLPIPTPISQQAPAPVTVNYNSGCNATTQGTGGGWNIEGNQGAACSTSASAAPTARTCGNRSSSSRPSP